MTACEVCDEPAGTGGARYKSRPAKYCSADCRATARYWRLRGKPPWRLEIDRLRALCEDHGIDWRTDRTPNLRG